MFEELGVVSVDREQRVDIAGIKRVELPLHDGFGF